MILGLVLYKVCDFNISTNEKTNRKLLRVSSYMYVIGYGYGV